MMYLSAFPVVALMVSLWLCIEKCHAITCGHSYQQKCLIGMGTNLIFDNNNEPSLLLPESPLYLSFQVNRSIE
jgi:hypothetical protein